MTIPDAIAVDGLGSSPGGPCRCHISEGATGMLILRATARGAVVSSATDGWRAAGVAKIILHCQPRPSYPNNTQ